MWLFVRHWLEENSEGWNVKGISIRRGSSGKWWMIQAYWGIVMATGLTWFTTFLYAKVWRMGSRVYWEQRASSVNTVAVIFMLGTEANWRAHEILLQTAVKNASDLDSPWNGLGAVVTQQRLDGLQGSRITMWTLSSSLFFLRWTRCSFWTALQLYEHASPLLSLLAVPTCTHLCLSLFSCACGSQ